MTFTFQIGIGIWLGGLFLIGTVWGYVQIVEWIKESERARPLRLWWERLG